MKGNLEVGHSTQTANRLKRISENLTSCYKTVAIVTFNSLILFFLLNFLLFVAFGVKDYIDTKKDPLAEKYEGIRYSKSALASIYPEFSLDEVDTLLKETWTRPYKFETYTQFAELIVMEVINRYLQNKKMIEAISQAYNVTSLFVWQPVPVYKYDLSFHLFAKWGLFNLHPFPKYGYPRMAELVSETPLGNNFLWAADIQSGINEPLYIDQAHYSNELSKMLATYIVDTAVERSLLEVNDL